MPNTVSGPTSCSSKRSPTTAKFGHRHGALHRAVVPILQVHESSRCTAKFGHRHGALHRAVVPVLQVLHLHAALQGLATATVPCTAQSCQPCKCTHLHAALQDARFFRTHGVLRSALHRAVVPILKLHASSCCTVRFGHRHDALSCQSCKCTHRRAAPQDLATATVLFTSLSCQLCKCTHLCAAL